MLSSQGSNPSPPSQPEIVNVQHNVQTTTSNSKRKVDSDHCILYMIQYNARLLLLITLWFCREQLLEEAARELAQMQLLRSVNIWNLLQLSKLLHLKLLQLHTCQSMLQQHCNQEMPAAAVVLACSSDAVCSSDASVVLTGYCFCWWFLLVCWTLRQFRWMFCICNVPDVHLELIGLGNPHHLIQVNAADGVLKLLDYWRHVFV